MKNNTKKFLLLLLILILFSCALKTNTLKETKVIYYESFDQNCGGFQAINNYLEHIENSFLGGGCQSNINLTQNSGQWLDDNHIQQFDFIYLNFYISTGKIYKPSMELKNFDLTNATIEFYIKGKDIELNNSKFFFFFGTVKDYEKKFVPRKTQMAYWANIANPLDKYLIDGEWHLIKFNLTPNIEHWKHAGYNPAQENYNRYNWFPSIEYSLKNVNIDILLLLTNIDNTNIPKGSIQIDEFKIYRN